MELLQSLIVILDLTEKRKVGVVVLSNISPQKDVNMTLIGNRIWNFLNNIREYIIFIIYIFYW